MNNSVMNSNLITIECEVSIFSLCGLDWFTYQLCLENLC